jgi:hypothetical protein
LAQNQNWLQIIEHWNHLLIMEHQNCLPNFMKIESPLNFGTLYSIRDFEKLESLIIFQELENNHHFDRFSTSKLEFSFNPKLGSFSSITNCHLVIQLSTPMCLFVEVTFDESSQ